MSYRRCLSSLLGLLSLLLCSLASSVALHAQYPLLPAGSNGNANYEWRTDLGGWRDLQTNLVWGYSMSESIGGNFSYQGANSNAPSYPQKLADMVSQHNARADYYEAQAAQETDPARVEAYQNLAAASRENATAYALAAQDASAYSNWRLPTLREFQAAWKKGLFSRGEGAFNMDKTPATGYDEGYLGLNWTSDPLSKNKKNATVFNLTDGTSGTVGATSSLNAMVVRSHTP